MKSVVGGLVVAAVLFVAGAVAWAEARLTRRVADAHQRLATLDYELEDDIDAARTFWSRLPIPGGPKLRAWRCASSIRCGVLGWEARKSRLASVAPLTERKSV